MPLDTRWARTGWGAIAAALLAGCGTPGAVQPPSLNLPERVSNLAAARTGNQVTLTWTMPKKNTDKILLKGNITVAVSRRVGGEMAQVNTDLHFAPGAAGSFTETLPESLRSGLPRPVSYL